MINAVITNKGNTLITEFPKEYLSIYEDLCSIDCRKALERIPLTDNEDDDIRVKLYADSDFGKTLSRTRTLYAISLKTRTTRSRKNWNKICCTINTEILMSS